MTKRALIIAVIMSASLVFGQLDSNSITVTASRSTILQPDQVVFSVDVSSGLNTSLDDIVAALAGSGITVANFSGLNNGPYIFDPSMPPTIDWSFRLPVSWSKMKDTFATLTALQKSITQQSIGLTLSFSVQGTQVSPQLQQSQTCSISDLLSDARANAQKLADASNLYLGAILAMSSFAPDCSLTVKFAVTR